MRIQETLTMYEKLNILTDAAKYDVPVLPAEHLEGMTEREWEAVSSREFAIVFRRMEDVSPFSKFCLPMNVFMTVSIV